ncbi:MAG: thioredoxin domain-containing protein, partial [Sphingobacteriaceae bacterium]
MPNRLQNSTSPYLQQHANNPVDWYPWGEEALQKAKAEDKLLLISIGYSACHWCHVMEHESFEKQDVADIMNKFFVCIKVDREERPDVDQIYMSAVQLMTNRGGWPLNCICLPDQRPVYGGTYFPKKDWLNLLVNLAEFYQQKPQEAEDYATRLTDGIHKYEQFAFVNEAKTFSRKDLEAIVKPWKQQFDLVEGGLNRAPKFPMPNNWQFLMRYAHLMKDEAVAMAVRITLEKMAFGGIYDQIGGGFARYSVDGQWHVPHFEKMLYDNAQLVSVYAEAFTWCLDPLYPKIIEETLTFIERELTSPEGGFYSALDADSEGVEGKFYTFSKKEVEEVLGADAELFNLYFHVTEEGNWEEEQTNIFFRKDDADELDERFGISVDELQTKINQARQKILDKRSMRVRPGLDYKILAAWNGLMLKGYCDAYRALDEPHYLEVAIRNASFILQNLVEENGKMKRVFGSNSPAFLDDYALVTDGLIALYEVTFEEKWLQEARKINDYAVDHFYDLSSGMFFYTSDEDAQLIARKTEVMDNVIPSSNSVMARNLKKLGLFFDHPEYQQLAGQLLLNIEKSMAPYGSSFSNWAMLLLDEVFGVHEIVIIGEKSEEQRKEFEKKYLPNKIILGGT